MPAGRRPEGPALGEPLDHLRCVVDGLVARSQHDDQRIAVRLRGVDPVLLAGSPTAS